MPLQPLKSARPQGRRGRDHAGCADLTAAAGRPRAKVRPHRLAARPVETQWPAQAVVSFVVSRLGLEIETWRESSAKAIACPCNRYRERPLIFTMRIASTRKRTTAFFRSKRWANSPIRPYATAKISARIVQS